MVTKKVLFCLAHTDFIESRGRPLILANKWRCSSPDNASQRILNYEEKHNLNEGYFSILFEKL